MNQEEIIAVLRIDVNYSCGKCGMSGVRLWRETHVMLSGVELRCVACALDQEKAAGHLPEGYPLPRGLMEQLDSGCLGYLVAARPTPDGTFWGHTSGDQSTVDAWCALPFGALAKVEP